MSAAPRFVDLDAVPQMTDERLYDHFRRKHEEPRERFFNPDQEYADSVCQPERLFR